MAAAILLAVVGLGRLAGLLPFRTPSSDAARAAEARSQAYHATYLAGLAALDTSLIQLDSAIGTVSASVSHDTVPQKIVEQARAAFFRARAAYKRVEVWAEYYTPVTADAMNGPALVQPDEDTPTKELPPTGFQVVEAALFPEMTLDNLADLRREIAALRVNTKRLREIASYTAIDDAHILDAARIEVGRLVALGLAGFDATLSGNGLREIASAFRGIREALTPLEATTRARSGSAWTTLDQTLTRAWVTLDTAPSFEQLDRIEFIVAHANPVAEAIGHVRETLNIPVIRERRAWRPEAKTLFEPGAWDVAAYAPLTTPRPTPELIALGEALFFEPALSASSTRSCSSCHDPSRAFTDGQARAVLTGVHDGVIARNTPTIINVGLQPAAFADKRVTFLEDQVTDVIRNPNEMGGDPDAAAARLGRDSVYRGRFARAFGDTGVIHQVPTSASDSIVTSARLRTALAWYMRSLTRMNSRFDRAVRGDTTALTAQERHGFTVFMGKGKCGTCHFAPTFSGAVPPAYTEIEVEVLGTPARPVVRGGVVDADVGRERFSRAPLHAHAFKTPSLRNVAVTAPYMHNGVYPNLETVIDFYDRGGGVGIGAHVPNQTLPADPLRLTPDEKLALRRFLETLTDTSGTTPRRTQRVAAK